LVLRLKRIFIFLALFAFMQTLYSQMQGTWLERLLIDHITVGSAAWWIDAVDPAVHIVAEGSRLRAPGGGINVLNGCEGTDVAFLLIAALVVAPIAWRYRLLGMGAGLVLVFVANQVRVASLFYAFRHDRALFDALHGVVTPMLLIAVVALFFAGWLARFSSRVSVSS
jgi:exosortase/archaeosortase family protein